MPATEGEMIQLLYAVLDGRVDPAVDAIHWQDGTVPTNAEWGELLMFLRFEQDRREYARLVLAIRPAQRKAYALLRRFLSPVQQRQLRARRVFDAVSGSGRIYRFYPAKMRVEELEQHGRNRYRVRSFCLHPDPETPLPPADVTLSQFLLLSESEDLFLATAHARECRSDQLWNGEWRRTLNAARRAAANA